ncbi:MAG: CopG family transcriptional regulator [Candidatus Lokiarchaeota archaeon]|nr:CopG family transcriptional regulator [Candidatus Lokiarchaeota archaeon]
MPKYRTVRLPEELVKSIKKIIKEKKELGYRNHSEFIIDATRRRVEKLLSTNQKTYDEEK